MSSGIKSVFWGSVSSQAYLIITMLVNLAVIPFTINHLDKEQYGFALVIMQLFGYFLILDFGLGNSLARFLSLHREQNEENKKAINQIISTGFFIYLLIGLLVLLCGYLVSTYLASGLGIHSEEGKRMIWMLSIFLAIRFPLFSIEGLLFAHQRQSLNNTIVFFSGLMNSFIIITAVYYGAGIFAFAYAFMASSTTSFLLKYLAIRKLYPYIRISRSSFKANMVSGFYSFGFYTFLNFIGIQLILHSDKLLVSSIVSAEAVAIFTITARIPEIVMTLINKIGENSVPLLVEKTKEKNHVEFQTTFSHILTITTVCVCISFWLMITFNESFVHLWVGDEFYTGNATALLITTFYSLFSLQYFNSICLYTLGKVRNYSILTLMQAGLNIFLSVYLGKLYGISGIITATILSLSLSLIYIPYQTIKVLRGNFKDFVYKPVIKPLVILSPVGLGYYLLIGTWIQKENFGWISMTGAVLTGCTLLGSVAYFVFLKRIIRNLLIPRMPNLSIRNQ